jgi:Tfp pilus assembly protein PilE
MTVALIIAILLLVAVASYLPASARAAAAACDHNRSVLERAAVVVAASSSSGATMTIDSLASSVRDFESTSRCPSDGTPYLFNPTTGSITCPNHP